MFHHYCYCYHGFKICYALCIMCFVWSSPLHACTVVVPVMISASCSESSLTGNEDLHLNEHKRDNRATDHDVDRRLEKQISSQ